jgi:hypothetical protein
MVGVVTVAFRLRGGRRKVRQGRNGASAGEKERFQGIVVTL